MSAPLAQLRAAVEDAAGAVSPGATPRTPPTLERPPRADFGDYSTNAAMLLAPVVGDQPRAVAERLGAELERLLADGLERVEVAGPGFLNLHLSNAWFRRSLGAILAAGDEFGTGGAETPERVLVEYVSANPTGPLTVASARHAAYGDALARILRAHGHTVEREYYFNDAGTQIDTFGASLRARARGEEVAEDGYGGEYMTDLAAAIPGAAEMDASELGAKGVEILLAGIKDTLDRFGVEYDSFFLERQVREDGTIDEALAELEKRGHLYRSDGASWLRSTDFGDDKDRVLIRSTGEPTYFAVDIAYHEHKRGRGYDHLINVLGADHHGYVARLKAAFAVLGDDSDKLEVILLQFVHLVSRGERASMSKRRGEFVTLDELIDEIGADVRGTSCCSARTTARSRSTSTWRARSRTRTPSTTSSTRTRASRRCWRRRGRSGWQRRSRRSRRRAGLTAPPSRWTPPSARSSRSSRAFRTRLPRPPTGARRTASPRTRSSSRRSSRPSTATVAWWAPSRARWSRSAWRSRWPRRGRSPGRWTCSE